jgi:hypothetical protein
MASSRGALALAAALLSASVGCAGRCAPAQPCPSPPLSLATAESSAELGGHARWYGVHDAAGSTLTQPAAAPFAPGGAEGTRRAARISGKLATSADAFAALVLELDQSAGAVFGSYPAGFGFWAQSSGGSRAKLHLSVSCVDGDSFGVNLRLAEGWTHFAVPFSALQPSTANRSTSLDSTRIRRIEWRAAGTAMSYDLGVDEVVALRCRPSARPPSCFYR